MQEITMARKTAAYKIHMDIMAAGEVAAESFSTFCRLLKTMRDDKLYAELEYSSFEDYCENAVGLKKSQAYAYIKTFEDFGKENSTRVEKLGIGKLKLLGTVPEESRDTFIDENKLKDMTTRQVEAAVKDYKEKLEKSKEAFIAEQKARFEAENKYKQQQAHVVQTNKYADEHMLRARDAEFEIEKHKTAMNALRFDLDNARKQLADAKAKGDSDKIKRLQDTVIEQVDKLEKLEDEKEELRKQLHDKPIEMAAVRIVEKTVIPDEVRKSIYNKVMALFEDILNLTETEIQIFAEETSLVRHAFDDVVQEISNAVDILNNIDSAVFEARSIDVAEPVKILKEVIPTSGFDPDCNCGICKFADMDEVTEEELENNKTLCTESKKIVDFEYGCDRFESAIDR